MTILNRNDSARVLYEVIQQLGWSADKDSIVDLINKLDMGLPAEDEFIFILSWLGKCSLLHKLDQKQFPPKSRPIFQVPDLFAYFSTKFGEKKAFIEIKVANKKKLNWKAEYLEKLKRYSSIFGIPLLVAWKFNGLWMLVDINCFVKAKKNFHLSLEMAMKNNLMSHLAGDFVYVMKPNVGLHILMKKECLISKTESEENSREETWRLRITEVFFTNSEGQKASNLPSGFWPLFITADPEPSDRVEKDFVYQSFVIPENQGMKFAHAALPVLINFAMKNDDKIHWRKQLEEHKYPVEIEQFYAAAQKGLEEGYVKYIFHLEPANIPNFLAV